MEYIAHELCFRSVSTYSHLRKFTYAYAILCILLIKEIENTYFHEIIYIYVLTLFLLMCT